MVGQEPTQGIDLMLDGFRNLVGRMWRAAVLPGQPITSEMSWLGTSASDSGVAVDPNTALSSTAFLTALRRISQCLAMLPTPVYRHVQIGARDGKQRDRAIPLDRVLNRQANAEMTSFEAKELIQAWAVMYGNGRAEIERNKYGAVVGLWPIHPRRIRLERYRGELLYWVEAGGIEHALSTDQIFDLRGFSTTGLTGINLVNVARNAIGTALAQEQFAARFFSNGASPVGILKHPNRFKDEAAQKRVRQSFESVFSGLKNAHRTLILEEGLDWTKLGFDPQASQMVESRTFQVAEVARALDMPLHMVNELSRATFANIEQQAIEFVVFTMQPWYTRWEQRMNMQLLMAESAAGYFVEFLLNSLLRGDSKARADSYKSGRDGSWLTINDIRAMENLDPIDDPIADQVVIPVNMSPAGQFDMAPRDSGGGRAMIRGRRVPMAELEKTFQSERRAGREKLRKAYGRLWRGAAERAVRREVREVKRAARDRLRTRDLAGLMDWMEGFYREAAEWMEQIFAPLAASYMDAIVEQAASEVGMDAPQMGDAAANYARILVTLWIGRSRGELEELMSTPGLTDEDLEERIGDLADHWSEVRPSETELEETVRADGVFSRLAWAALGFSTLRWQSNAGACPLCQSLNGKIAAIKGAFADPGSVVQGDETTGDFEVKQFIRNPPLHRGCVCSIVPA